MITKIKTIFSLASIIMLGLFLFYNRDEVKIFASVFEDATDENIHLESTNTSKDSSSKYNIQPQVNKSTFLEFQVVEEIRAILQKASKTVVVNYEETSQNKPIHSKQEKSTPKDDNKQPNEEKGDSSSKKDEDTVQNSPQDNDQIKKDESKTKENQENPIEKHELLEFEKEVIRLTNIEREKQGLLPLKTDFFLSYVARKKSEDMNVHQYFAHKSPTYGTPFQMLDSFGIYYTYAGENLAHGFSSPAQVISAWMDSEGHRKNILNDVYTYIGIGYEENGHFWTMLLIRK